jgi:ribosomal protein S18 acetylase RimI-like enzyme
MLKYLDNGYHGFSILKGKEIIGDIWYLNLNKSGTGVKHPDLKLLDIKLKEKESYMFDMYIKPEERGNGTVNFLLGNALNALKEKGVMKVYGYYTAGNVPALWIHRTLGYKELKKLKVQRILFTNIKLRKKSCSRMEFPDIIFKKAYF